MSAESVKALRARMALEPITLSKYEDQNGLWAKDLSTCFRVRVEFASGTVFLEPADVRTLTRIEQVLINNAPSSPPA